MDQWGGCLENRLRLPVEVVRRIRQVPKNKNKKKKKGELEVSRGQRDGIVQRVPCTLELVSPVWKFLPGNGSSMRELLFTLTYIHINIHTYKHTYIHNRVISFALAPLLVTFPDFFFVN
jgi:hypothetical protein